MKPILVASIAVVTLLLSGCTELEVIEGEKAYKATGGGGDWYGEGVICDLSKPFELSGGGLTVEFVPDSPDGGSYSYEGVLHGVPVTGGEAYSVKYEGDLAVSIKGWGVGSVPGYSAYGEEFYELTLLKKTPKECAGS